MAPGLDYLFIGDDFTGASDTLATLARAGRRVELYLDPPDTATVAREALDAVGIATELRALAPEAIRTQIDALAPTVKVLAPRVVHYKVCSTFDSSQQTGSIGAAVAALRRHLDPALVAVVGGQPSLGRYCAFGNLFARGPDGEIHRIDRHPVMSRHPTTPMGEADLRLHLSAQGLDGLRLEAFPTVSRDVAGLAERLSRIAAAGGGVLFDALDQDHLDAIGAALEAVETGGRPLLVVGASSVAEAFLGKRFRDSADARAHSGTSAGGPCLVVAGSRSETTAAQIEAARRFDRVPIAAADLVNVGSVKTLAARCAAVLGAGANVLAHLAPAEDYGVGGMELSRRLAMLVSAILDRQAVSALGIAGGDTSSIVVRHLGFRSLAFEELLDPGVAVCIARSADARRDGMRLMLKGGQVGSATVFDRFAERA